MARRLRRGRTALGPSEALPKMSGLRMFPVMLLGPSIAGIVMIRSTRGKDGLRDLLARMSRIGSRRWLATLLLPPALVVGVLFLLKTLVSPVFSPNRFPFGFAFGCAAGFCEEIGWTAFAFPVVVAVLMRFGTTLTHRRSGASKAMRA